MEKKFVGLLLLICVLLSAEQSMVEVEAKTCTKPSKYYKGPCGTDKSCADACKRESWPGGRCHQKVLSFTCVCERPC